MNVWQSSIFIPNKPRHHNDHSVLLFQKFVALTFEIKCGILYLSNGITLQVLEVDKQRS